MFCAILAADTAVQNSALVELNAVCVWFLDLQTAAPLARNVAQPAAHLRSSFASTCAASAKQTTAGSFGGVRKFGSSSGEGIGGSLKSPLGRLIAGGPVEWFILCQISCFCVQRG